MSKKIALVLCLLLSRLLLAAAAVPPRFGVGLRVSTFGFPNALLDRAFFEHPQLSGNALTFEVHSFGEKGPKSVFSGIYSLEYSRISGEGNLRVNQYDHRFYGSGDITQVNITATIIMHIFPSSPIHPYIGGGIGIGHLRIYAKGSYEDELGTTISDSIDEKLFTPVGHIPIGIIGNFSDKFLLRAEAGFKNGFYFGGSLAYCF